MFASLGMYPFECVTAPYRELWGLLTERVPWLPDELSPLDEGIWTSEKLALSQTCGWPLITSLAGKVRPVGSFHLTVPSAVGWMQRSVIVGADPLTNSALTAAVNADDSLSGWISLLRYSGVSTWSGEVLWTGSHVESCLAVAAGQADVAAIDSLSMEFMRREGTYGDLPVVGQGPLIPTLPLITSNNTTDEHLAELRDALASVVNAPANAKLMDTLMIGGFSPLDQNDYLAVINP